MPSLIGFGECSKYYLYILATVIIKAVKDVIFGFSDIDQRNKADFQIIKPIPLFCQHNLLQNLIRFLGLIAGGFIFLKIEEKNSKANKAKEEETEEINKRLLTNDIKLLYTDVKLEKFKMSEVIVVAVIMCIYGELRKLLYLMNFYFIDFWAFNVVFMMLFMRRYYKIEFYNFQKCSLYFIVIASTLLLLINTVIPQKRMGNKNEFDLYEDTLGNASYSIFFLIAFICLSFILSYARVKIKFLTETKFISNYKIIIYIGIFGIIMTLIEIIFSECFECHLDTMNETFKTLCFVNNTKNETYHDEIKTFFDKFGTLSGKDVFINIILILTYPVICFFEISFELLIIYYLNPIYMLVRDNIYNVCLRIIFVSLRANTDISAYITPRFFILEFADIFAILGYCVYFQLFELKFCSLNKDINKNIIDRGVKESILLPLDSTQGLGTEAEKNGDNKDNISHDDNSDTYSKDNNDDNYSYQ